MHFNSISKEIAQYVHYQKKAINCAEFSFNTFLKKNVNDRFFLIRHAFARIKTSKVINDYTGIGFGIMDHCFLMLFDDGFQRKLSLRVANH